MYNIKKGFSLAEILISLTIIGVVSAITIPILLQKHQEKVTVIKVKKFYSTISQAYESYVYNYGYPETWNNFSSQKEATTDFANKFKPYLKVLKDCGYDKGCFINENYKRADGSYTINFITHSFKRYMFILNDGSAVAILVGNNNKNEGGFYYDINGTKPPNQFGKDIFQFSFDNTNKLLPGGYTEDNKNALSNCLVGGFTCANWIIKNGNMDYLHCPTYLTKNPLAVKCPN